MKRRSRWAFAIAILALAFGSADVAEVRAQSVEELKQRILDLERSTRERPLG